jgi:hypothetical protein
LPASRFYPQGLDMPRGSFADFLSEYAGKLRGLMAARRARVLIENLL